MSSAECGCPPVVTGPLTLQQLNSALETVLHILEHATMEFEGPPAADAEVALAVVREAHKAMHVDGRPQPDSQAFVCWVCFRSGLVHYHK